MRPTLTHSRQPRVVVGIVLLTLGSTACNPTPNAPTASPDPTSTIALAPVNAIGIEPATTVLKAGETQQFSVTVELGPGVPGSGPVPLWTTSNPSVLAVTPSGAATAVALGEATIRVTFRGHTASRRVKVAH
jgi:uncharacterized protein YjdB